MQIKSEKQKVLIVDDVLANIEILYKILQKDYDIYFAKSGRDALRIVKRELPDLILLDIMMPEMDGYQVCCALKEDAQLAAIPVIFVTAMGSDEDEAKGLDCGAIDYITKPISPAIVKARVRNHLELKRSRDLLTQLTLELEQKNRELSIMAREDALTGLANRRHFNEVLDAEINRAMRTGQPLSLIICDLDHFKRYNDSYGHLAGDRCLQTVGEIFRQCFQRASDLAARYGGEEFAVILPNMPLDKAVLLAERLRREVIAQGITYEFAGDTGVMTLSLGVAGGEVTREHNAERFIREADQALYRSKENGRNLVTAAR